MTSTPIAPGSVVLVRDEEWLVTSLDQTADGQLIQVQGLSELVSGTTAAFYDSLDEIEVQDPAAARLVADDSPHYRRTRLWLEATVRKTPVPLADTRLAVTSGALANALAYQRSAVRKALEPSNLRPRILLADAVGLGKTLEIGMILSELARRGRADRVLIVCPRHVLEQMQQELWTRFALPFVRLDSLGVQRVRQELPATRNPFTYFKRVIISIDTLKQDRFVNDLRRHRWDAVVIDEVHNVTNSATHASKLARILAPNTDALVLASATPHNGRAESFAELIRLLEPTAVSPDGDLIREEVERLVVRRHRHSPEVAQVVGDDWAERREPQNLLVDASRLENAVAAELDDVWLHPGAAGSPYSGSTSGLFPWTLAKAFLSSPAALQQTLIERRSRLGSGASADSERRALDRLAELNEPCLVDGGAKYDRLLAYLREIQVGPRSANRAVIFAERVKTLEWLQARLRRDLGLPNDAVQVLHGGLSDDRQQQVVESFKLASSPIRLLITGDVASEGVNLHVQCHELIHFDIPWSLIRIEQRNGRIDRYGQRHRPQITTLLLRPDSPRFAGDLRVLSRLLEREQVAHAALGDTASLMGKYSVMGEEEELARVLAGQHDFDDAVAEVDQLDEIDPIAAFLAELGGGKRDVLADEVAPKTLYDSHLDFLRDAVTEAYETPEADPSGGGVRWREHLDHGTVSLQPPPDLRQRLRVLPQSYLRQRRVDVELVLAVTELRGKQALAEALTTASDAASGTSWPEAHYLAPLHPVLDWAADRVLNTLDRHQVFVVRGAVDHPVVVLQGTLTNRRGQVVAGSTLAVEFPDPGRLQFAPVRVFDSVAAASEAVGLNQGQQNLGPVQDLEALQPLLERAVRVGQAEIEVLLAAAAEDAHARLDRWQERASTWTERSERVAQTALIKHRRLGVRDEKEMAQRLAPDRSLVRALVMVVPADETEGAR
ncbi:DEAD/DEAH box helicase [Microlunatus spumicola]|uniref:DEAD/DEAH box helicase n=1 Tax=Microlunatus spumicola TaxID=81499 RepID=A0ABP6XRH3_9ACTN